MPKDQVEIKFGPGRLDSPKGIKKAINDAASETAQAATNNVLKNTDYAGQLPGGLTTADAGGGTSSEPAYIDTFVPSTNLGTATLELDGAAIDYTNGLTTYLVAGDYVLVTQLADGSWVVTAILARGGAQTPVDQAISYLSAGFPIQTNAGAVPFKILASMGTVGLGAGYAYDMTGALGFGADLIVGGDATNATAVNAFARSTATSISLFTPPLTGPNQFFIQPSTGRLISLTNTANTVMYYRLPGAAAWTAAPTTGTIYWTFDYESGAVWGITQSATTPFGYTVWRFLETDAAPVNMGAMGIPNGYQAALHPWIASGHGYLTMSSRSAAAVGNYYVKPSSDSTNFTFQGTYATGSWGPTSNQQRVHVNPSGSTTYLTQASPTNVRELRQGGTVFSYNTGIPLTTTHPYTHRTNSSGLVMVQCSVQASVFGGSGTVYTPCIASFNGVTTTYQYYNIARYAGSLGTPPDMTSIVETSAGTIRFGFSGPSLTNFDCIELSGL